MTRWQQTLEVARWEFSRFVKWRQQFVGLALMVLLGVGGAFVGRMIKRAGDRPVTVTVVGREALAFPLPTVEAVSWDTTSALDAAAARAAVADETIDAALLVGAGDALAIVLRRRAGWTDRAVEALTASHRQAILARVLTPEAIAALGAPFAVETSLIALGAAPVARSTRIAAIVVLSVGLILVMTGFGTLFAGITGEKQHRVTEQMLAMVSPQVWIDGKIIGLTAAALAGTSLTVGGLAFLYRGVPWLLGRSAFALPPIASDIGTLGLVLVITLLGVLFWFAFMAAVAATIDDPNSSTRTLLLFVPLIPMGAAFALLSKADSIIAQVLGVFPLTSMAVLPLRLVLTTVAWWEVPLALALLAGAAWGCRLLAGRIFGAAMLMYGKEPSLREMVRWMRHG
ncbi:MAG: ABC transporter permease [Gemmatimonadetes bacterium]|nr:ABC transporter permease [Gemmatimonadota bacterium]MBP7549044.1 ABC transporter permease [Gemmatimonadaceae bacterium]